MKLDITDPEVKLQTAPNISGRCKVCNARSALFMYIRGVKDKTGKLRRLGFICQEHYIQLLEVRRTKRYERSQSKRLSYME